MPAQPFDLIVVGLGAMGSAAAYHLAQRGARVLGLEQFRFGHDRGSSHGASRVIRLAYFEDPAYVPLLRRAYELWERLERDSGSALLTLTGGLMIGSANSDVVTGSLRSAREHGLPHELLDAREIHRRFPPFAPAADQQALYEPRAGVLRPEACVLAHLARAAAAGADVRAETPVIEWRARERGEGVTVRTAHGVFEARHLLLCPGAWAPALFDLPQLSLTVERQVLYWFDPVGGTAPFAADRFPVYIWEREAGIQVYGFPALPGPPRGVKVAFFRSPAASCTADTIDRVVGPGEVAAMRAAVEPCLPALGRGAFVDAVTCMYTTTPDHHFVLGAHPRHPQVTIASPCSGHGFKFASVIGEILADLAMTGTTCHPIDLFSPTRFVAGTQLEGRSASD